MRAARQSVLLFARAALALLLATLAPALAFALRLLLTWRAHGRHVARTHLLAGQRAESGVGHFSFYFFAYIFPLYMGFYST